MSSTDLPLEYDDVHLERAYRVDIIVNRQLIVEIKSVEHLLPVHEAQLLTYLRVSPYKLGLFLNFNTTSLKDSIRRCIL